jgi:hypothetical protein
VVERAGDLRADLVEFVGCNVQVLVGVAQLLAGVLEGSAGRFAQLQGSHELQAR